MDKTKEAVFHVLWLSHSRICVCHLIISDVQLVADLLIGNGGRRSKTDQADTGFSST